MRSTGRAKVLYFINGMVPTDEQRDEARAAGAVFRNAALVDNDGASALEECDAVMGDVPPRYRAAFGAGVAGDVSGVGALRSIHAGEAGVSENQPINLNSTYTGDPVEEERKRAARGLTINEAGAAKAEPGRLDPAQGWGLPVGIPGAGQLRTGEVSQIRSEQAGAAGQASPIMDPAPAPVPAAGAPSAPASGADTVSGGEPAPAVPLGTPTWG